jgi:hypothetical protein
MASSTTASVVFSLQDGEHVIVSAQKRGDDTALAVGIFLSTEGQSEKEGHLGGDCSRVGHDECE